MRSAIEGSVGSRPDPAAQARRVALTVLALHLTILAYDIATQVRAFTWGDRGIERLRMVEGFAALRGSPIDWMAAAPVVPGEYLFVEGPWQLGGAIGVILFQIALAVLAAWLVARTAGRIVPWPRAALGCGLAYALLPQNLAFPHQLVTEAVATPLCAAWLALVLDGVRGGRKAAFAAAGLCLGLAILARPVIAALLPIAFGLALLVPAARPWLRRPGLPAMAIIALAPLLLWTAVFTAQTGHLGYNNGSASLGWNLRSKALITERANRIAPPADLLPDEGGIASGRFLEEVGRHPAAFAKAFALDTATVFARGNSTKITVDYLGFDRDPAGWRQKLVYAEDARQSRWRQAADPVYLVEGLASLLTVAFLAFCLWQAAALGRALVRGRIALPPEALFLTIIAAGWLIEVFVSAQLVNEAQGRLRNPAEAALILFAAMAWARRRGRMATVPNCVSREADA